MSDSLHIASLNDDIENVKKLIENGKDVNSYDINGNTLLHEACINGNIDIINFLISNNANINKRNYYSMDTPLHKAVQFNHIEIVQLLIDAGVSINIFNVCRKSPLYIAYYNERLDIVNLLIKYGAYLSRNESLQLKF